MATAAQQPKGGTIYDSYPLSLRSFLADGPAPFVRSLSEDPTHMSAEDDDFLATLHHTGSSVGSVLDMGDNVHARTGATRASPLCSTFGKFHNEVFETKERSKVLSALRHRGKATKAANGIKQRSAMRPPAPSTFTADDVLRAGTLTKQGSWRRNWKTRFFILRSDCPSLCYFTSEDKLELLGEIPVTEDTIVLDRSGGGHAPFRFQVRTEAQTLLLEAESRENQKRWIDSCQELADAIRASKFSVNTNSISSFSSITMGEGHRRSSLLGASSTRETMHPFRPTEKENGPAHGNNGNVSSDDDHLSASNASSSARSGAESVIANRHLYDVSVSVSMGRRSKLARSVENWSAADKEKDKIGVFVVITGYSRSSNSSVELGATDAMKLSTLVTACGASSGASGEQSSVPFSVIMTAELEKYDVLRLTLCKTQLSQSPGNIQATIGVGRCLLDDILLGSMPCAVPITERSTSTRDTLASGQQPPPNPTGANSQSPEPHFVPGNGSSTSLTADSDSVQLVVQAFRSVPAQSVLRTTGVDMANTKYLIPTTLAPGRETATKIATGTRIEFPGSTRGSDVRTFMENDSFLSGLGLGSTNDAPTGNLRYVAVDEILRVPRSTFALPVAFLDFLEEQALERSRWIQKQLGAKASSAAASPQAVERLNAEMDFLRKKQEEYLKQRQFIIRQEKRLLDEQKDGKFFMAAKRAGMVSVASDTKERESVANAATTAASATAAGTDNEPVAPFKRSTYKNLNLWQFLPTNMQDQFLCTYKPPTKNKKRRTGTSAALSSRPFVWHTMTMGCPAAHTKGFANGGYPASVPVMTVSPASSEDDAILESSYNGDVQSPTSPMSSSRGTTKIPSTQTSAPADDSLAAFKLRLDLQDRLTVIGSQILSATAACVLSSLDLAVSGSALHQAQLDRAPTFGYLMNFESLLSTQGKEYGMLEDFAAGARWLRNVFIQFRRHSTAGTFFSIKKYAPADESTGNGEGLLLTMGVTDDHLAVLPKSLVSGNAVVHVRCVLFTQGVNEKQSLVHAYKSSAVKLQERVNRDNLVELKRIYTIYRNLRVEETQNRVRASRQMRANSGMSSSSAQDDADEAAMAIDRHDLQALDDLLVQIEHHICSSTSQYKKNVALLMDSSDFCRALGGARITCCKSGKDRTAMSVTLEQARLLCGELQASQGSALCSNMRLYGVRRRNVFMNTKADKFAFNEVQRKMLPDCYKPPAGTYKSGKT